MNLKKPNQK